MPVISHDNTVPVSLSPTEPDHEHQAGRGASPPSEAGQHHPSVPDLAGPGQHDPHIVGLRAGPRLLRQYLHRAPAQLAGSAQPAAHERSEKRRLHERAQ